MKTTPYLIQRAIIATPLAQSDERLSKAVKLDYMGSAEFEFGALPKSLRALQEHSMDVKKTVLTSIKHGDTPLKVIHIFSAEEMKEYEEYLHQMRKGSLHLKETTFFEEREHNFARANFWWDIENHVMWSFDKSFMNRLPEYLVSSWKYMDEK